MRSTKLGNQSCQNAAQRLLAFITGAADRSSRRIRRARESPSAVDRHGEWPQRQARARCCEHAFQGWSAIRAARGEGRPPDGSTGGRQAASNPFESEDFISRLAGSTTSEESVAWCGRNAIIGFNDSGSFGTLFPPSPSPSGSLSFDGWSMSANAGASFSDKGILLPDPIPLGSIHVDLFGDPVVGCTDSATFYYASLATNITATSPIGFSAISLSKSIDGGASFGGAKIAVQSSDMLDKEWMAVRASGRLGSHPHHIYPFCFRRAAVFPKRGTYLHRICAIDGWRGDLQQSDRA